MARQRRMEIPGYYHVINRGVERRQIFLDSADYTKFMLIIDDARMSHDFSLHAWVLMPNHYHLLLKTEKRNLSAFMKQVNGRYTIFFNRKYERVGPLWQGRFKSWFVQDEAYLNTLIKYIEYNPVKAGISEQIGTYQWASGFSKNFLPAGALSDGLSKAETDQIRYVSKPWPETESWDTFPDSRRKSPLSDYFEDVSEIFDRNWRIAAAVEDGHRQVDVAEALGISQVLVSKVIRSHRQKRRLFETYKQKGLYWSYSKDLAFGKATESLFYETILKYGEFEEVKQLISWIGKRNVKRIWEKKMVGNPSFKKVNLLIARVFLDMPVEADFFENQKNGRFEKLKLLASQNPGSFA